jgi:hypothetical protein
MRQPSVDRQTDPGPPEGSAPPRSGPPDRHPEKPPPPPTWPVQTEPRPALQPDHARAFLERLTDRATSVRLAALLSPSSAKRKTDATNAGLSQARFGDGRDDTPDRRLDDTPSVARRAP